MKRRSQQHSLDPRLVPAVASHRRGVRAAPGRRLVAAVLLVLGTVSGLLALLSGPAGAQGGTLEACPEDLNAIPAADTTVRVAKVSGLLDPVMARYLLAELDHAEANGVLSLVIQLDSSGSVLDDDQYVELVSRLMDSPVTIAMWVGQSGATATGGAGELLGAADLIGVTPRFHHRLHRRRPPPRCLPLRLRRGHRAAGDGHHHRR